ncbi:MAG: hypothetical protein ACI8W8_003629 [Rhodothermales bacterium]|jgi:hypothetical protein
MMKVLMGILIVLVGTLGAVVAIDRAELAEFRAVTAANTRDVEALELELVHKDRRADSLARQLKEAREQLEIANRTIDRLDDRIASAPFATGGDAAGGEEAEEKTNPQQTFMKAISELMEQPDMKAMIEEQQRVQMESQYADFFEEVAMDKTTEANVRELLLERLLALAELGTGMMAAMSDEEAMKAITEEMSELSKAFDDEIKEELGEDYDALQEYESTIQDRDAIKRLQTRLGDEQMDAKTKDALLTVMQEEREASDLNVDLEDPAALTQFAQAGDMTTMFEGMEGINERVYERSAAFLTEKQLAALGSQQKMESGMFKMSIKMMEQSTTIEAAE